MQPAWNTHKPTNPNQLLGDQIGHFFNVLGLIQGDQIIALLWEDYGFLSDYKLGKFWRKYELIQCVSVCLKG